MSTAAPPDPSAFAPTRWTLVLQARGGSADGGTALGELCEAYYGPVEAFIRRQISDPEAARDFTQEFFARLLASAGVAGADPARGRFRSYLLGAVKNFLHAERTRRQAGKRGGTAEHLSLENAGLETGAGLQVPDARAEGADVLFDRQWANTLLERSLRRLGDELGREGKAHQFEVLKPSLLGAAPTLPQGALAAQLGLNESALKVTVHRLRKRFRDTVKAEIAETLNDPGQVEEEMQHLLAALT